MASRPGPVARSPAEQIERSPDRLASEDSPTESRRELQRTRGCRIPNRGALPLLRKLSYEWANYSILQQVRLRMKLALMVRDDKLFGDAQDNATPLESWRQSIGRDGAAALGRAVTFGGSEVTWATLA